MRGQLSIWKDQKLPRNSFRTTSTLKARQWLESSNLFSGNTFQIQGTTCFSSNSAVGFVVRVKLKVLGTKVSIGTRHEHVIVRGIQLVRFYGICCRSVHDKTNVSTTGDWNCNFFCICHQHIMKVRKPRNSGKELPNYSGITRQMLVHKVNNHSNDIVIVSRVVYDYDTSDHATMSDQPPPKTHLKVSRSTYLELFGYWRDIIKCRHQFSR
jgi:hypothetical protein